jgi:hypothetical protein
MAAYSLTLSISWDSPEDTVRTVEALGKSLSSFAREQSNIVLEPPTEGQKPSQTEPAAWYALHGEAFLDELTPNAERALLFVAGHSPAVSIRALADELQLGTGPALAGKLASIGWAVRRLSAPAPFRRVRDRYEIEPSVAEALLAARPDSRAKAPAPVRQSRRKANSAGPASREMAAAAASAT